MSFADWLRKIRNEGQVLPDDPNSEPGTQFPPDIPEPDPYMKKWAYLDKGHVVPRTPLEVGLKFLEANASVFKNRKYVTVCNFTEHSSKLRFYIVDLASGEVERHAVAHGSNSDPDNDGYATAFSNVNGSHQSSLGIYLTDFSFEHSGAKACILKGLSDSNSRVEQREIIIHAAHYVKDGAAKQGRSWGCMAFDYAVCNKVVEKLKGGSLIVGWHDKFPFEK